MRFAFLTVVCVLMLGLTGCYAAPVMPPMGMLFTNIHAPLDIDAEATPLATKVGASSSYSVLGLIAFGDCSLDTAARAGGLTRIEYIDYGYLNVLGIIQQFSTEAHGD